MQPIESRSAGGPSRRAILCSASMLGVAGFGFAAGAATTARATDFADDFQQAVRCEPGRNLRSGERPGSAASSSTGGGARGQSHQSVVDYLSGENVRWSSAHYVVSSDRVTQLVGLADTAFHAGVYDINARSIRHRVPSRDG